jgi:hypothetical protein
MPDTVVPPGHLRCTCPNLNGKAVEQSDIKTVSFYHLLPGSHGTSGSAASYGSV